MMLAIPEPLPSERVQQTLRQALLGAEAEKARLRAERRPERGMFTGLVRLLARRKARAHWKS